jgi:hypothetical protein
MGNSGLQKEIASVTVEYQIWRQRCWDRTANNNKIRCVLSLGKRAA